MARKKDSAFIQDNELYNKKIKSVPASKPIIDVDTDNDFYNALIQASLTSSINLSEIDSFSHVSQTREYIYQLLDTMSEDPIVSTSLQYFSEDATEMNQDGKIIWATSENPDVVKFINYILETMNVDKNIYKWAYSLCKYGDLYLKLYHKSEFERDLFTPETEENENKKEILHENVTVKAFKNSDNFVFYLEQVPNPAEMFELTRFGKTYAYIKAPVIGYQQSKDAVLNDYFRYKYNRKDISLYCATDYVHACLEDNSSRTPEEIEIFLNNDKENSDSDAVSYSVRRGQSILQNTFKIWRELMLLENAMLLNRITKSSVVRIVNVEVGDMPKTQIGPHLQGIKQMMEQKSTIDVDNSMGEYTNPGPTFNNIYVPTHNQQGAISLQTIGGDTNVTGLEDLDYFKNKFYGALGIPKQYLGDTDDATGFNGGTSLSIVSSKYAKTVKRIQNTLIQAITDAVNIILINRGQENYVNKFKLHLTAPTTQEEINRMENFQSQISTISDITSLCSDIDDPIVRLGILKCLLANVMSDSEVLNYIQEEIDKLEAQNAESEDLSTDDEFGGDISGGDFGGLDFGSGSSDITSDSTETDSAPESEESTDTLPSPEELGAGDFSDSNNPNL